MEAKVDTAVTKAAATSTKMPGASTEAIQGMKRHTATIMNATIGTATTVDGAESDQKINSTGEIDLSRKSAGTIKENKRHDAAISATSTTLHRATMEAKSDTAGTKAAATSTNKASGIAKPLIKNSEEVIGTTYHSVATVNPADSCTAQKRYVALC